MNRFQPLQIAICDLQPPGYTGSAISKPPCNQAESVETARDLAQRMDKIFAV